MLFLKFFSRGDKKQHLLLSPRSQQQMEAQFHQGSLGNQWVYLTSKERTHEWLLTGVWALQGQHLKIFTWKERKFLIHLLYIWSPTPVFSSILYTPALPLGHMIQNSWKNLMPYSAPLWVWGGEWRNINHQQAQLILSFASAIELSEMAVSWIQGQLFKTDIILMDSWFVFPWRQWMWKTFWNNTTAEIWCSNTQFLYSPSMPAQFLDILQLVSELQSLKREVARSGGAHL